MNYVTAVAMLLSQFHFELAPEVRCWLSRLAYLMQ